MNANKKMKRLTNEGKKKEEQHHNANTNQKQQNTWPVQFAKCCTNHWIAAVPHSMCLTIRKRLELPHDRWSERIDEAMVCYRKWINLFHIHMNIPFIIDKTPIKWHSKCKQLPFIDREFRTRTENVKIAQIIGNWFAQQWHVKIITT